MHICKQYLNPNIEHFDLCSTFPVHTTPIGDRCSDFYHYRLVWIIHKLM